MAFSFCLIITVDSGIIYSNKEHQGKQTREKIMSSAWDISWVGGMCGTFKGS